MPNRAPPLVNAPPAAGGNRPVDLNAAAEAARYTALAHRNIRQRKAVAHAERLWGVGSEPFALAGLAEPEPWNAPVATAELLDVLAPLIARHVRLSAEAATVLGLWLAHAWSIEWAAHSPRLAIFSASAAAGKTTALRVIAALSPRPLMLAEATLRPLLRLIDSAHPTLLIDEADRWALGSRRLRMALVSGHARDGLYVGAGEKKHEEQAWSCFTPCAVTLARAAPPDFARRCITVTLQPASASGRRQSSRLCARSSHAGPATMARPLRRARASRSRRLGRARSRIGGRCLRSRVTPVVTG